ncbi:MAG: hypothetical protein J6Q84_03500 [Kiritimatiellae bacterium]|nr:hypothetical protein [Kiritimatiellia bacterium]
MDTRFRFNSIEERVAQKSAILVAPEKPLEISRVCHDLEVMQRVYGYGRRAAELLPEHLVESFFEVVLKIFF